MDNKKTTKIEDVGKIEVWLYRNKFERKYFC